MNVRLSCARHVIQLVMVIVLGVLSSLAVKQMMTMMIVMTTLIAMTTLKSQRRKSICAHAVVKHVVARIVAICALAPLAHV